MKRTHHKRSSFLPDIHPESLPLLALVVSALSLAGLYCVWVSMMDMKVAVLSLEQSARQNVAQSDLLRQDLKRVVSVRPGTEPISYAVEKLKVTVLKDVVTADFKSAELKIMADACNVRHPDGYFTRVADGLRGAKQAVYTFRYDNPAMYMGGRAILLQNALKYKDVNAARSDFASCGGAPLPVAVNKDWVLFLMPCIAAKDNDPRVQFMNEAACQVVTQALATVRLR